MMRENLRSDILLVLAKKGVREFLERIVEVGDCYEVVSCYRCPLDFNGENFRCGVIALADILVEDFCEDKSGNVVAAASALLDSIRSELARVIERGDVDDA